MRLPAVAVSYLWFLDVTRSKHSLPSIAFGETPLYAENRVTPHVVVRPRANVAFDVGGVVG